MFNSRTVFVLGAGASHEIGMPLGEELLLRISERLGNIASRGFVTNDDRALENQLQRQQFTQAEMLPLFAKMSRAMLMSPSIDNYLFDRNDDQKIVVTGKIAIAQELLRSEAASALWHTDRNDYANVHVVKDSWYWQFFRLLNERISRENIRDIFKHVTIINFNYDRSIKHFLFKSLQDFYDIDHDLAVEVMETLQVIHPYGSLRLRVRIFEA